MILWARHVDRGGAEDHAPGVVVRRFARRASWRRSCSVDTSGCRLRGSRWRSSASTARARSSGRFRHAFCRAGRGRRAGVHQLDRHIRRTGRPLRDGMAPAIHRIVHDRPAVVVGIPARRRFAGLVAGVTRAPRARRPARSREHVLVGRGFSPGGAAPCRRYASRKTFTFQSHHAAPTPASTRASPLTQIDREPHHGGNGEELALPVLERFEPETGRGEVVRE